ALMHSLKHYKVLHEKNVILTIDIAPTPRIDPAERVRLEQISATFSKVKLRFGFMESPNVPKALAIARKLGWQFDIMSTSFFLSRRALKPAAHSGMPRWQDLSGGSGSRFDAGRCSERSGRGPLPACRCPRAERGCRRSLSRRGRGSAFEF